MCHGWCLKWGGGFFFQHKTTGDFLFYSFYGSCIEKWYGEMDRQMGTGKVTISNALPFSLPHTSVCTLCQVMAQPQSLHCFYDLSFHTWIILSLKLQRLEAGNLLHSVPGYFLLQRRLVFIGVFHTKSDGHPTLHYYIWLTCAEVHFHQNWEYWPFS